ncbi:type I 3-dehydroquinate dehydratase [Candidatus Bathyarchaeota archaeon]|nr:MAG: type I 3-dehydroquinate dehydratase [Candidatus Bathyarchaeota archaeon]
MKPKVCVPVRAKRSLDLIPMIREAEESGADLIEVRLDYLDDIEGIERVVEEASIPLIATNRLHTQGGFKPQDEEERVKTLIKAAEAGFDYVDIEFCVDGIEGITSKLKSLGVKPIVSFHDFNKTPSLGEMESLVRSEVSAGAEVCKLVTTARTFSDNLSCLLLVSKLGCEVNLVCFAMGRYGVISRVLSPIFGGYFTYASLREGLETAPGQIAISTLKEIYRRLGVED